MCWRSYQLITPFVSYSLRKRREHLLRAIVQGDLNFLFLSSRLGRAAVLTNSDKQGIGDRIPFCAPVVSSSPPDGPPPKPDTLVLDICLYGAVWTAYLALHYFRRNGSGSGKLVFTSSMAGIYPAGPVALYGAAKHGVCVTFSSLKKR
jgi:NAD(P)-dependent dehydrogenase (short-subunit alcohol dehydrogenase family)